VQELKLMVDLGIAPIDALLSATRNAADLVGFTDRSRIADGCWADLLIVRGNPAEDIRAVSDRANHRMVLKAGIDVHATLGPVLPLSAPRFPELAAPAF